MIKDPNEQYFEWMYDAVMDGQNMRSHYRRLMTLLHHTKFEAVIPLDDNRATDGIDLRYRFGRKAGIPDSFVAAEIDVDDCSMLEMMVALAIRIEEHIMGNSDIGNRTGQWFFAMVDSLGLLHFTDSKWTKALERDACDILETYARHEYQRDGRGSLFYVPSTKKDFRNTEIWYQMCEYLKEIT